MSKRLLSKINRRGFTLLEVLLAVSITAIVMVIVLTGMRLAYRAQERGLERAQVAQHIRTAADRVSWLLRGAYPYRFQDDKEPVVLFFGESDSVEFVTTSVDEYEASVEDLAGLKAVRIYLDDGLQYGERMFFMTEHESGESADEKIYTLDPSVKSIAFEYLRHDPEEKDEEWVDEWDPEEDNYLPLAVKMEITFEYDEKTYELPPVIVAIRTGGYTAPAGVAEQKKP